MFVFLQCGLYSLFISFVCKLGPSEMGQGHVEINVNDLFSAKSEYQFNYVVSTYTKENVNKCVVASQLSVKITCLCVCMHRCTCGKLNV